MKNGEGDDGGNKFVGWETGPKKVVGVLTRETKMRTRGIFDKGCVVSLIWKICIKSTVMSNPIFYKVTKGSLNLALGFRNSIQCSGRYQMKGVYDGGVDGKVE